MDATPLTVDRLPRKESDQRSSPGNSGIRLCDVCDLALEADHRIANHLAMLTGYVSLVQKTLASQSAAADSVPVQIAFDSVRSQIGAVSRLHRWLATPKRGAGLDVSEYLHHVCAPFMSGLSGAIDLTEDLDPGCLVRSDQILPVTQIVSEVITNAIKYSHSDGGTGKVSVRCHFTTQRDLEIEVIDDGCGLPRGFDFLASRGLGFRLIRALAAQIGGQCGFDSSDAGTRFWLRMEPAHESGQQTSSANGHAEMSGTPEFAR